MSTDTTITTPAGRTIRIRADLAPGRVPGVLREDGPL